MPFITTALRGTSAPRSFLPVPCSPAIWWIVCGISSDTAREVFIIKRIFVLPAAAALLLSGCSAVSSSPELTLSQETACTVKTCGTEFSGTAQSVSDGIEVFTLASPKSVEGLCCRRAADGLTLSRGDLLCRSTRITLGDDSAAALVFSALGDLRSLCSPENAAAVETEKTDDGYKLTGKTKLCKYTAFADETGKIVKIKVENI